MNGVCVSVLCDADQRSARQEVHCAERKTNKIDVSWEYLFFGKTR